MKKTETTKESLNKAHATTARKHQQWKGGNAMRDHQGDQLAIREKLERLRALRDKLK